MAKKSVRNFDKDFLENRQDTLQRFLTSVCAHRVLGSSPALAAFLTASTLAEFDLQKAAVESNAAKHSFLTANFTLSGFKDFKLEAIPSESGEVRARLGLSLHRFSVESEKMFRGSEAVYNRLKEVCTELAESMDKSTGLLKQVEEEVNKLKTINEEFNMQVTESKWTDYGDVLSDMSNSMKMWSLQMANNSLLVKEHLFKAFKYARKECEAGLEVLRTRNIAGQGYFQAIRGLNETKDALLKGEPGRWDLDPVATAAKIRPESLLQNPIVAKHLMMPAARESVKNMGIAFGYLNDLMVSEVDELGRAQAVRLARGLGNWSTERAEVLESEQRSLKALMAKLRKEIPVIEAGETPAESP